MALLASQNFECPCGASSPADPKIVSEDTNKMSKSQQLMQRYDSADFGLILKTNIFCCTLCQDGVRGGPVFNQHAWDGQGLKDPCFLVLNQHVWDGQGLKNPCFFGTFLELLF
jgi:hypothetical protein